MNGRIKNNTGITYFTPAPPIHPILVYWKEKINIYVFETVNIST